MGPISAIEIAQAVRGQIKHGKGESRFVRISRDSRHILPGDLFVALKGERFNGHDFVLDALAGGAAGVMVETQDFASLPGFLNVSNTDVVVIFVNDTLKALGDLAAYYRQKLPTHIIAVTGSNGKTTTKDIIHHLLSQCAMATKSPESFNNCIGVPLTIFELNSQTDFGIIEMGTNAPGEIRRLSEIVRPHTAVFTNISETHLEGLGSVEGVAKEKGEMLNYIDKDGTIVINADNVWCNKIAKSFSGRIIRFGINNQAQIKGSNVSRTDLGLAFTVNDDFRVNVPFYEIHNVYNCLAALAVCYSLGFDIEKLSKTLLRFRLPAMRMDRQNIGDIAVINDAYNANPQSMLAALNEYSEMKVHGRKIFICGDMLELGNHAERLHKEIGIKVAHAGIDLLLTVGKLSRYVAESATAHGMAKENTMCYDSLGELLASIVYCLKDGDTILIKGSRRIGLEGIIERIESYFANRDKFTSLKRSKSAIISG
ncbi:MAG TPA: UDP-N-acetylmuramoyl-tripeptide--D-alanyl-D-alanine ligase [Candidatus Brocadiia bacterium]|nr:UDP-N-acetylmuramoyl-tripeptide--D-alanyl-D-alanine ligase [Planctomycetota bacterium]MDO8092304.1 UDP-N-acetylmuramoyl-tripeptide--D-alanyl-D-alanine ligase [Candidatus Brocadiales bacterium]